MILMFTKKKPQKCHRTMYPASTTTNDRRLQPISSPGRLGFPRPQGHRECRTTKTNDTAHRASVGCVQQCWARMTEFSQHLVWSWVSQLRTRLTAAWWSQALQAL